MTAVQLLLVASILSGVTAERTEAQNRQHTPRSSVAVMDTSDRKKITGRVSIALAWGERFSPPAAYLRGFIHLKEAITRWTNIEAAIERHFMLSSPRIMDLPFVYITADEVFDLTATERENVEKYLTCGGFIMIENANPRMEYSPAEASLKQMIRDSLGRRARFAPIPNDHQIYHSFFDFSDGPPIGAELWASGRYLAPSVPHLEGVWLGDRLAVVFSNKGYIVKWTDLDNNTPQLKMGVNILVYAMTQEGGITIKQ